MKKYIVMMFLCFVVCLSLCACGEKETIKQEAIEDIENNIKESKEKNLINTEFYTFFDYDNLSYEIIDVYEIEYLDDHEYALHVKFELTTDEPIDEEQAEDMRYVLEKLAPSFTSSLGVEVGTWSSYSQESGITTIINGKVVHNPKMEFAPEPSYECEICGGKLECARCGESGLYCENSQFGSGTDHFCGEHWADVVEWHNK